MRLTLRRAIALSTVFAATLAAAAAAGSIHPGTLPVTMTLPPGWTAGAATPGVRFNASGPTGYSRLQVTSGGSFPSGVPFSEFVKTETTSARAAYRKKDPQAAVSGKKVTLPSGPAVEITAVVHKGTPLGFVIFSLLHKGITYHFTYFTYASSLASMRGSFEASARSIRFTK